MIISLGLLYNKTTNMSLKFVLVLCVVTMPVARPQNHPSEYYGSPVSNTPAQYNFNWQVKDDPSGNDFGHEESRDGDNTQGSYYVLLPDGRLQRVTYTVNGNSGYVAEVTYEGEAQFPTYQSSYTPAPRYA
ncbi:pro-resilin-like isoform X2 [Homarus americanus]|uniref:pro-resilin-like isoform X2 n=1 Tax=Homarus americanus TaxID=6706 RepID=UPI001C46FEB3|nr:pro-resilin-like isoform X2 [Homarus americanus]